MLRVPPHEDRQREDDRERDRRRVNDAADPVGMAHLLRLVDQRRREHGVECGVAEDRRRGADQVGAGADDRGGDRDDDQDEDDLVAVEIESEAGAGACEASKRSRARSSRRHDDRLRLRRPPASARAAASELTAAGAEAPGVDDEESKNRCR